MTETSPSQPLYTRLGLGESVLGYRDDFLTLALPCMPSCAFHIGRGLLRRCLGWASHGPIGAPCGPSVFIRPGILTHRSHGVTPSNNNIEQEVLLLLADEYRPTCSFSMINPGSLTMGFAEADPHQPGSHDFH